MGSFFEDPTQWRLRTPGGIPYKLLSFDAEIESVKASSKIVVLIPSTALLDFGAELFPPPKQMGTIFIPQYKFYGNSQLCNLKMSVKSFNSEFPVDPFTDDPDAPPETYYPVLACTIDIGPPPTDPTTFLEVSSDANGEYIHAPASNTQIANNDDKGKIVGATKQKSRMPHIPSTVLCPQTMWSVVWKMIPLSNFKSVILPRLKTLLGKVNSKEFNTLYTSDPETLLFTGYSYSYSYTWQRNYVAEPLIDVTMKVLEKKIVWRGQLHGHNSIWYPGQGWKRQIVDNKPPMEAEDFNLLVKTT